MGGVTELPVILFVYFAPDCVARVGLAGDFLLGVLGEGVARFSLCFT